MAFITIMMIMMMMMMIMITMMMIKYYIELILFIRHFQHITTMTRFPSSLSIHLSKLAFSG